MPSDVAPPPDRGGPSGRGTAPRTTARGRLSRLGFDDPDRAARLLGPAPEGLGLWVDGAPDGDGADEVVAAVVDAPDPDLALRQLVRLTESSPDAAQVLEQLRSRAGGRTRLLRVLGTSEALGDHLVRHPDDLQMLMDDDASTVRPSALGLQTLMLAAVGVPVGDPPPWGSGGGRATVTGREGVDSLRRAYRRQLLSVAARDCESGTTGDVAVEDVAGELADLAAATLAALLALAAAELGDEVEPCRLAVVALGKCGGRELNYVSDVDVVFAAAALPGGDEGAAMTTATRLAAGILRLATVAGSEAPPWPVDANLRPEGKDGPLVRTLASHEAYYQRWAKTWEFQALLKARPAAGDIALGQEYVALLAPQVWTAAARDHFVPDVQAMRRRVEQHLPRGSADREVKLGPGGLRDIEFSVQLLQLVHGRWDPSLRGTATLPALQSLVDGGYVGREDAAGLAEAYRFLRRLEHRLQLPKLRRTHLLPEDPTALRHLARSMGYRSDAGRTPETALAADRAHYAREVRRLHEKLFYRPLLTAVARLSPDEARITDRLSPEAARTRLAALGFTDPAGALGHLEELTAGVSRRAAIQRTLLPAMLASFADAADPDAGLLAYRRVSETLDRTPWYLRLLRDEGEVADRLARLLAGSAFVADLLVRAPEAVELLGGADALVPRSAEQLEQRFLAVVRRRDDWEEGVGRARALRRAELVRVAAADLEGLLDVTEVGTALSSVASATLSAAFEAAWRKVEAEQRRELPFVMTVIGMGRLGGREQGYGSDADVMFVHEPLGGAADAEVSPLARAVAEEMRRLLALPAPDPPLLVDAGLRPEGKQGPLSRSLASFEAYYARWSHVWESQALLRACPVAGHADLGARFLALADGYRYPEGGVDATAVREIRRIKARIEAERLPRGADPHTHPKLGRGGLADVEWTAQLLQLQHAHAHPSLRTTATVPALTAASEAGLLAASDAEVLAEAWTLATRVRNAVVLFRGRPGESLPPPGRELSGVARALGYPAQRDDPAGGPPTGAGTLLLDDYRKATRRARAVVERVFYA